MDSLKKRLDNANKVRIVGNGTDISFSIKGIGSKKCSGERNIPDGEIYTAPVKESVNGTITFNAPSVEQGFKFENVSLTFENGKIIKATANDTEKLNAILNTDEGARYVGEFAFGVNPYITKPMLENFSILISDNNIENRNINLNLQNIVYTILNINNEIEKLAILKQKYLNKFFG